MKEFIIYARSTHLEPRVSAKTTKVPSLLTLTPFGNWRPSISTVVLRVDGSYFRNLPELSASRNATKKCLQNSIERKYKTRDVQEKTTELDKTKFFHKKTF